MPFLNELFGQRMFLPLHEVDHGPVESYEKAAALLQENIIWTKVKEHVVIEVSCPTSLNPFLADHLVERDFIANRYRCCPPDGRQHRPEQN